MFQAGTLVPGNIELTADRCIPWQGMKPIPILPRRSVGSDPSRGRPQRYVSPGSQPLASCGLKSCLRGVVAASCPVRHSLQVHRRFRDFFSLHEQVMRTMAPSWASMARPSALWGSPNALGRCLWRRRAWRVWRVKHPLSRSASWCADGAEMCRGVGRGWPKAGLRPCTARHVGL